MCVCGGGGGGDAGVPGNHPFNSPSPDGGLGIFQFGVPVPPAADHLLLPPPPPTHISVADTAWTLQHVMPV